MFSKSLPIKVTGPNCTEENCIASYLLLLLNQITIVCDCYSKIFGGVNLLQFYPCRLLLNAQNCCSVLTVL